MPVKMGKMQQVFREIIPISLPLSRNIKGLYSMKINSYVQFEY